MGRCPLAVSA